MTANSTQPAITAAMSVEVREATFDDYRQVRDLEAKFHLGTKSYEEWTHLWTGNPAYREAQGKVPIGWVLKNREDGVVFGHLGNIPLYYELEGKRHLAAATHSWVVHTSFRAYSLLPLGKYFRQTNVDLLLNTTVNSQAVRAYSFFKGIAVPVGAWDRSLFWITHYPGFAESLLRKKRGSANKALSYLVSGLALARDWYKRTPSSENGRAVEVVPCASFDERFDAFWADLRKKKSNVLLAVRTREVLEWHFKYALEKNLAWVYTVQADSRLVAYGVFLRDDQPDVGLRRVRLVDFQSLDAEIAPVFLRSMLRAAIQQCRRESIHMLELVGFSASMERELEVLAPNRRRLPNWLYFYKTNHPLLSERLKCPAAWDPSLFDGDSSL